jgi:hypothetical protein
VPTLDGLVSPCVLGQGAAAEKLRQVVPDRSLVVVHQRRGVSSGTSKK